MASLATGLERFGRSRRPRITGIESADREPIGVPALTRLARALGRQLDVKRTSAARQRATSQVASVAGSGERTFQAPDVRLLMFGGKGGVGKTTCAAAAALNVSRRNPGRRVLLVSTDPAHSLSDVLCTPAGDAARRIPGGPANLDVRELDAALAFAAFREDYSAAIDRVFDRITRGSSIDASHDRRVLHDLLELAPPGLDEIAAVLGVIDLLSPEAYDTLIVDTAPTGHALRLLETPATVQDWTKALMAIVLKYQTVIGVGELGATLLRLSRRLGSLRALLANPRETQFVIVTRAAALPGAETRRLFRSLRRLRVHVAAILFNAAGAGTCARCRRTSRRERELIAEELRALRRPARGTLALLAPAVVPPPSGMSTLEKWFGEWRRVESGKR
jgi:arsenite-transporting ATPase